MTGPLTWEQLTAFAGIVAVIVGSVFAIWLRVEAKINAADGRAGSAFKAVADLELKLAREYATISHLQQSEERLTKAITRLEETVERLPQRLAEILHLKKE